MRYRHWKNWATNGETAFVTTTCLDFVHAFRREEMRELISALLIADCSRYRSPLYGFVVMPHHVHYIVQCPPAKTVSWLVQRFKSNSAKLVLPRLTPEELACFDQQRGLNRRSFWMDGFRSVVLDNDAMFDQKLDYVHWNPVEAGYCEQPVQYRWSSARLYAQGGLEHESGLRLDLCLPYFDVSPESLLVAKPLSG